MVFVHGDEFRVGDVGDGGVADTRTDDGYEDGGDRDAPEGECEDLPALGVRRIITIIIRRNGTPPRRRGEAERHEAQKGSREAKPRVEGRDRGVDLGRDLADQDA